MGVLAVAFITSAFGAYSVSALSCLPVEDYLSDVVGKEEIVIFAGSVTGGYAEDTYDSEVVRVDTAYQGYVEEEIFVYHEKSADWGYLCNSGPGGKGSKGVYVASRDAQGKYHVYQRLELNDPLITQLKRDLEEREVEGGVSEITKEDRMNQIMTTISDLFVQISILLKEYLHWKQ